MLGPFNSLCPPPPSLKGDKSSPKPFWCSSTWIIEGLLHGGTSSEGLWCNYDEQQHPLFRVHAEGRGRQDLYTDVKAVGGGGQSGADTNRCIWPSDPSLIFIAGRGGAGRRGASQVAGELWVDEKEAPCVTGLTLRFTRVFMQPPAQKINFSRRLMCLRRLSYVCIIYANMLYMQICSTFKYIFGVKL